MRSRHQQPGWRRAKAVGAASQEGYGEVEARLANRASEFRFIPAACNSRQVLCLGEPSGGQSGIAEPIFQFSSRAEQNASAYGVAHLREQQFGLFEVCSGLVGAIEASQDRSEIGAELPLGSPVAQT